MAPSVAILGSGNMAFHLLSAFQKAGIDISALIVRDLEKGQKTVQSSKVQCPILQDHDLSRLKADIVILAVPDHSLPTIQQTYTFSREQLVVHTAGAQSLDVLSMTRKGVFYPLQTLTWGEQVDFSNIPILIEASSDKCLGMLQKLGQTISQRVQPVHSEHRLHLHLAAVLVSNFSNHLMAKAQEILSARGFDLELLFPLMDETSRKAKVLGPLPSQTGPAIRRDEQTLQKHLTCIEDAELNEIYRLMTKSIQHTHESLG